MSDSLGSLQMLRVHVAPVGFEVDRIVIPAIQMKADRVWLITHNNPSEDKGHQFVALVQNRLNQARIECLQTEADRTELFHTLRALRIIILKEKGNSILVNVSVGSKIQAIASMMACMMFKDIAMIKPYYVVPETYTSPLAEETKGVKKVIPMPEYNIELPDEKLIKCMAIINQRTKGEITKHDLKDLAKERNLIHVAEKKIPGKKRTKKEYSDRSDYMSLNKTLIEPLRNWRFITETKIGTNHIISLTDEGKHALHFLSANIENT
jgi:hypothetical protein